jgi:hypothetical protein
MKYICNKILMSAALAILAVSNRLFADHGLAIQKCGQLAT